MALRAALVLIVFLAGCAAPVTQWEKPGASQAAVDEAMQQCRVEARLSPQQHLPPTPRTMGTPGMDRIQSRDADEAEQFQKCMRDRGYSAKP
jgi:hypothetical protein